MATRKQIPLIPTDATLTIAAAKTLEADVNVTVSGADVSIVGSGTAVITFPSATSTLATLAGTETLTNKTIDGVTPTVMGYVDPTSSIQTQLNAKGVGTWTDSSTSTGSNKTFVAPALGAATATSINGYPINATPTANNIPVLTSGAVLP